MEIIERSNMPLDELPGRSIQRAVGKNSAFDSGAMTVGYAGYSAKCGVMEPHRHAEETVVVFDVKDGRVCWGDDKDNMPHSRELERGMILHIPENEWHAFYYDEGGFVDIVFIYGTSDNVRPEDNN